MKKQLKRIKIYEVENGWEIKYNPNEYGSSNGQHDNNSYVAESVESLLKCIRDLCEKE